MGALFSVLAAMVLFGVWGLIAVAVWSLVMGRRAEASGGARRVRGSPVAPAARWRGEARGFAVGE